MRYYHDSMENPNGLREFSKHALLYTYSKIKNFARNYWDLGASVLPGFAINDYGNQILGAYRSPLVMGGVAGGLIGATSDSDNRFPRNFFGGLASYLISNSILMDASLSKHIENYAIGSLMAGGSLLFDYLMRKERKNVESSKNTQQKTSSGSLEERVVD